MAKHWAVGFYQSTAWRRARKYVLLREHGICQRCGDTGNTVHHKVELTPDNINDMGIALNPDLMELLCKKCHDAETSASKDCGNGYEFNEAGELVRLTG